MPELWEASSQSLRKMSTEGVIMSVVEQTDEIFDASKYDLPIPRMDGHKADTIVLALSSFNLDRTSEDDLALIEELLILGQEVELHVKARVIRKGFRNVVREDGVSNEFGVGLKVHAVEAA